MQHLLTEIGVWLLAQVVLNEEAKPVSQDWVKLLGQVAVNDVTPLNRDWGMVAGASCS